MQAMHNFKSNEIFDTKLDLTLRLYCWLKILKPHVKV